MPLLSTRGASSAKGFGLTAGGGAPVEFDFLVVAGGGGGGSAHNPAGGHGGAAGGGGVRTSFPGGTKLSLKPNVYTITVGGGGTGGMSPSNTASTQGQASTFSNITSAGGGKGASAGEVNPTAPDPTASPNTILDGGSGGGMYYSGYGFGNRPPVSPPQGNDGFSFAANAGPSSNGGGGGGGSANAAGSYPTNSGGPGGNGAAYNIDGNPVSYGGGGGGGVYGMGYPGGSGGSGGGGSGGGGGNPGPAAGQGSGNTGGGGGGGGQQQPGGQGGSGKIILRGAPTDKFSVAPGSNTVQTNPTYKLAIFNVSGSLTVGID